MKDKKISIWFDEEGDFLEINLKKSKDTYFNQKKKDFCEIIDKKTGEIVGYVIFNFTKRKEKFIDMSIPIEAVL